MTQEYTPVTWQDETTSQQGTLINAERLNQMQTAHHYADGFEEVDAVPTADPGVDYHKIVYCTADSTIYRWDGTEWTKDIDDETKRLLLEHEADHDNPHQVTKAQVGLGNADNTSDQNKPVSTAQAAAIKLVQDYLDAHEANHDNPHQVTKAQVGLGNADNTADADKPVSTAAQTALDGKVSIIPVTTGVKFYAQTSGGTTLYQGTANAQTGITSVPLRDSSGRIKTETPSADTDCANKKYADDGLATKADKATTLAGYGITDAYTKSEADTLLAAKLDILSTAGLHAYTHNGATQSEVSVIDGTTASTIPIRDTNGRLQAADPESGATNKSLVTANWVSQSGDDGPNNLLHKNGNETKTGVFTIERLITRSFYFNARSGTATNSWRHIATISGTNNARVWGIIHHNQSQRFAFFEIQLGPNPKFYLFIKKSVNVNNVAINYDGNGTFYIMIKTPYIYQTGAIMPFIIQNNDQINPSIYQDVIGGTIYNDASEFPLANTVYGQFEGVDTE